MLHSNNFFRNAWFLDFETTGLNPSQHYIWEVGYARFSDLVSPKGKYRHFFIKPPGEYNTGAQEFLAHYRSITSPKVLDLFGVRGSEKPFVEHTRHLLSKLSQDERERLGLHERRPWQEEISFIKERQKGRVTGFAALEHALRGQKGASHVRSLEEFWNRFFIEVPMRGSDVWVQNLYFESSFAAQHIPNNLWTQHKRSIERFDPISRRFQQPLELLQARSKAFTAGDQISAWADYYKTLRDVVAAGPQKGQMRFFDLMDLSRSMVALAKQRGYINPNQGIGLSVESFLRAATASGDKQFESFRGKLDEILSLGYGDLEKHRAVSDIRVEALMAQRYQRIAEALYQGHALSEEDAALLNALQDKKLHRDIHIERFKNTISEAYEIAKSPAGYKLLVGKYPDLFPEFGTFRPVVEKTRPSLRGQTLELEQFNYSYFHSEVATEKDLKSILKYHIHELKQYVDIGNEELRDIIKKAIPRDVDVSGIVEKPSFAESAAGGLKRFIRASARDLKGIRYGNLLGVPLGLLAVAYGVRSYMMKNEDDFEAIVSDAQISSDDEDYIQVEALSHKGLSHISRRQLTDFGSGWQGLPKKIFHGAHVGILEKEFKGLLARTTKHIHEGVAERIYGVWFTSSFKEAEEIAQLRAAARGTEPAIFEIDTEVLQKYHVPFQSFKAEDDIMHYAVQRDIPISFLKMHKLKTRSLEKEEKVFELDIDDVLKDSKISAKDDDYNTIESLKHEGVAGKKRKKNTDFGSGYRGLLSAHNWEGRNIAEEILDFRNEYILDKRNRDDLRGRLHQEQIKALARLGRFKGKEVHLATDLPEFIHTNKKLYYVNTDDFKVTIEDADTLILKRRGLLNIFDKPIYIRVAGLDAPETEAHDLDPLSFVRWHQSQPMGEETTELSRDVYKNLSRIYFNPSRLTYGRYVGVLTDDEGTNLNIKALEAGLGTELYWSRDSLFNKSDLKNAEDFAKIRGNGLWQSTYWLAEDYINHNITHNTLTRIDKLAEDANYAELETLLYDIENRGKITKEDRAKLRILSDSIVADKAYRKRSMSYYAYKKYYSGHVGTVQGLHDRKISHTKY